MGEEEEEAAAAAMLNPDKAPEVKKPDAPVDPAGQGNKSKEQLEMEEALAQRIRPLNLEGMDTDQLRDRVQEYWRAYTSLKGEKAQLERRLRSRATRSRRLKRRWRRSFSPSRRKRGLTWRGWLLDLEASPQSTPQRNRW